jgi:uncharacterized protein DUF4160
VPTVSRFYGIRIAIYFGDHAPPHFHALYAGHEAQVRIADGAVTAGWLPLGAARLVRIWWTRYKSEIERSWDRTQQTGLVEPVPPLE